jgi:alpha-L-rhamnosidase
VGDLQFVKASHRSPYGLVSSDWQKQAGVFRWKVTIPANTTATVYVPAASAEGITEGGKPIVQARGVRLLRMEQGRAVVEVGSGNYTFSTP